MSFFEKNFSIERDQRRDVFIDITNEQPGNSVYLKELKRRAELNNGNAWLFIHPYYSGDHPKPQEKRVRAVFERLVNRQGIASTPVIVFEEAFEEEDLYNRLSDADVKPAVPIFLIRTHGSSPLPYLGDWGGGDGWKHISEIFQSCHITTLNIGGTHLYDRDERSGTASLWGCVGAALQELSRRGFTIKLSSAVSPLSKKEAITIVDKWNTVDTENYNFTAKLARMFERFFLGRSPGPGVTDQSVNHL